MPQNRPPPEERPWLPAAVAGGVVGFLAFMAVVFFYVLG
jgi:hypothetical protein